MDIEINQLSGRSFHSLDVAEQASHMAYWNVRHPEGKKRTADVKAGKAKPVSLEDMRWNLTAPASLSDLGLMYSRTRPKPPPGKLSRAQTASDSASLSRRTTERYRVPRKANS